MSTPETMPEIAKIRHNWVAKKFFKKCLLFLIDLEFYTKNPIFVEKKHLTGRNTFWKENSALNFCCGNKGRSSDTQGVGASHNEYFFEEKTKLFWAKSRGSKKIPRKKIRPK